MIAVAIYARYSSDLQRDASIEDQIRLCEERARREGWRVHRHYTDHGISGASLERPGIRALLQDAQAGGFQVILAEALDRLSRGQADIATIYERMAFAGIRIVTLTEGEIGALHVGLKGTMNSIFLQDLAEKTRRGLRGRIEAGRSGGGNSFGYDVVRRIGGDGLPVRGERSINEEQARIIRRIFAEYAAGNSPQAIAKQLNREGIPGPSGKAWGPSTIHGNPERGTGILNNELYVGCLIWNRLRYIKDPETGRRVSRLNSEAQRIAKHVPLLRIVEQTLWDAVKARQATLRSARNGRKRPGYWDRRRPRSLLSGLMTCGSCGGGVINLNAERVGCAAARAKGTCDSRRTMRRDDLETLVLEALQHRLMDPALCERFCDEYARHWNRLLREHNAEQEADRGRLAKAERELDRLVQALADGVPASRVKARMIELEARRADVEARLAEGNDEPIRLHPNMAAYYRAQVMNLREALYDGDRGAQAAALIRRLIDRIVLTPVDHEGRKTLSVDLHGHLAGILAMARNAKKPLAARVTGASGSVAESVKLVAGARNTLHLLTEARVPPALCAQHSATVATIGA